MSKPDKPKTPESEKIVQRFQAKMGREGTQLATKVGSKFVANINRDRKTRGKGTSAADVAVAQKRANAQVRGNPIATINNASKGSAATAKSMVAASSSGVMERTQRQAAGNNSALNISSSVTRAGLHMARDQSRRGIDKMQREFQRANELVDLAGAMAGTAIANNKPSPASNPASMSMTSASGAQSSAIVDMNDPLSMPAPQALDWSNAPMFAGG